MGWDLHVHDNSSHGRKTPSQLVIDAFIKGISEITVAFNLLNTLGNIDEVLSAGDILGVRVNIGAEFSVLLEGRRFHFMYLLPRIRTSAELDLLFKEHAAALQFFIGGLNSNQESRIASIHALIDNFNAHYLPALNAGYDARSIYALAALDLEAVDEIVPTESLNRMYLGELLYAQWKPVLLKRVLLAKSKLNHAGAERARGAISEWDYANIATRYRDLRETYTALNPEVLCGEYFGAP
jgi:predicted metal-dependent phosphoesterase TrpH